MTVSSKIQAAIREFFSDEKPHKRTEIRAYLETQGIKYSEGHFSGSINTLVKNGSIKNVARGVYVITKRSKSMKKCFVVSPIGAAESDIRRNADQLFRFIIEPICQECGFEAIRVDHLNDANSITDTIIDQLENADLVIADVSSHNPNVFYEMGYRARTKKPMIHLKEKDETLPFDITTIRTFEYDLKNLDSVAEVKNRLKRTIQSFDYTDSDEIQTDEKPDAGTASLLPVLYEILDKVNRIGNDVKNINSDMIGTIIKSMQSSQPQISTDTALQMQLLGGLIQNPDNFMKLAELYDKLPKPQTK